MNPGPVSGLCDISLCHINIRSLSQNKIRNLKTDISRDFDIIALSETFLSDSQPDSDFQLQGFHSIMRRDRPGGLGGGVALYTSQLFAASRRHDLEVPDIELLWSEIRLHNNKFLLGVVYRPPNSTVSFWDKLQDSLDLAKATNINNIILTGDLNSDPSTPSGTKLLNFCSINLLSMHIDEPTRITQNSSTCLDQFITNMPSFVSELSVHPPISNCDHCVISAKLKFRIKKDLIYKRCIWNYKKANFDLFRRHLNQIDWNRCLELDNIDNCALSWSECFLDTAKKCIPSKSVSIRPNDLPWYNSSLRCSKRKVMRAYNKAKSQTRQLKPSTDAWATYKRLRNIYQEQLNLAEEEHRNKLNETLKSGHTKNKSWWKTVKYFLNRNHVSSIPSLLHEGIHVSDSLSKAKIFNSFFLNQCNLDTSRAANLPNPDLPENTLSDIDVNEKDVLDFLQSLDVSKATGPDGIGPRLLKEAAPSIYKSLTKLFKLSLQKKRFPSEWKLANVTPIYKKGNESLCNNYRPISLLSCVGKVMEKIVFKHVFNFFRDNFVISANQSGFMPSDSTVNQLLLLYHELCLAVDEQKEVRVIFLDISKAFDKVWHEGLLHKIEKMVLQEIYFIGFGIIFQTDNSGWSSKAIRLTGEL